jgi:hypothetical protein
MDFINLNSKAVNLEWDPRLSEKLLFNPYSKSPEIQERIAHYFLMVSSITESNLIGRAENARALMIHFNKVCINDLYDVSETDTFQDILETYPFYNELGPERSSIPEVLVSVNEYVRDSGDGHFLDYICRFASPQELVEDIARKVERMNEIHVEKAWLYVLWCSRPYPDLGLFNHFSLEDMKLPLTSYTSDVARCLGFCPYDGLDWRLDVGRREEVREKLTGFCIDLVPDDPGVFAYPFYYLGRWIREKNLSLGLLRRYLEFFNILHQQTGSLPVTYDIVSREMSSFEKRVRGELEKTRLMFQFESLRFNLPGGITYRPDFVLPECKIKGRTVLLEPHGIWGLPENRVVNIGGRKIRVQAYSDKPDPSEVRFTNKIRSFRETFGNDYYLILIVPSRFVDRVKMQYPAIFDELYVGTDIPELLYKLQSIDA